MFSYERGTPVTQARSRVVQVSLDHPDLLDARFSGFPQVHETHGGHPGGNPGGNLKLISHICHPFLVALVWVLTKDTINLPLGCLQGPLKNNCFAEM